MAHPNNYLGPLCPGRGSLAYKSDGPNSSFSLAGANTWYLENTGANDLYFHISEASASPADVSDFRLKSDEWCRIKRTGNFTTLHVLFTTGGTLKLIPLYGEQP